MKSPSDMTDRELDAAVAVEVMGWKQHPHMEDCWTHPSLPAAKGVQTPYRQKHYFCPSTDIAADYKVLVRVRETWGLREQNVFYALLDHTWAVRTENRHRYVPENVGEYRPGDYARAALAAVRGRK